MLIGALPVASNTMLLVRHTLMLLWLRKRLVKSSQMPWSTCVGCGALTVLIRYFGGFPEGVTYAILIMNLCTWAIDKGFHRHQFGVTKEDIAAEKAAKKAAKEEAASQPSAPAIEKTTLGDLEVLAALKEKMKK